MVMDLGNPAMKPSHWRQLFTALGQSYFPNEKIKLRKLKDGRLKGQRNRGRGKGKGQDTDRNNRSRGGKSDHFHAKQKGPGKSKKRAPNKNKGYTGKKKKR